MNFQDVYKKLADDLTYLFSVKADYLNYDKTFRGKVINILPNKKCKVLHKGKEYIVKYYNNVSINDMVWVCAPGNDWNELYIQLSSAKSIEDFYTYFKVKEITLTSNGWSDTVPYIQTVNVPGTTSNDRPTIGIYLPEGITAVNVELQNEAYDCVDRVVTGNGFITVYCYNKKPTADFQIQMKGV